MTRERTQMTEPVDIFKELGIFQDSMPNVSAIYLYEPRHCVCCGSLQQKLWIIGMHSGLCDVCFKASHAVIPNPAPSILSLSKDEGACEQSGFLPSVEVREDEIASRGSQ